MEVGSATGAGREIRSASGILFLCFFLSGATALIYEVVWLRMLGLVFGHTVYAITTVLAAFMAGLGLGSILFGRRAASSSGTRSVSTGCSRSPSASPARSPPS
jgi:predicted membrane-bound spermidine synthase